MNTRDFEVISDAELERATGGITLSFIGPFPVLKGSNPMEEAQLADVGAQLTKAIGPIANGDFSQVAGLGNLAGFFSSLPGQLRFS